MPLFLRYVNNRSVRPVLKPIVAKLGIAITILLSTPSLVQADGIYMTNMKTSLTQSSIDLLTDPARPIGVQTGDIVEYVLQSQVANAAGGPGVYFTTYLPTGVEVLGAWFVTDATGGTVRSPGQGGRANDGWGLRGSKTPFGAPFIGVLNSRQNDLSGDTGIFYSTDSRTQLFTADSSGIAKGPTGNPSGTAATSNGYNVTDTFYKGVDAFNLWDADQVNAFGAGGALGSVPVNPAPTSSAKVINSIGQGSTPVGSGSPVAGLDTGYTLDNTGNIGPWRRIQYPGSQIANVSDGAATGIGTPDSPTVLPTSLGASLSDSSPLPSNTNAVRWAYGFGALNAPVYIKVRVRVNAAASTSQTLLNFEANGSDNWGSGSKDNPWRYFGPTIAQSSNLFVEKEIVQVNGQPYLGGTIVPGATVTYQIRYLNLGSLPVKSITLLDKLSPSIATTGCTAATPTLSGLSNGVTTTVSGGTVLCPISGATVTFGNLPKVVGGSLGSLRGGSFTYNIKIAPALADNLVVGNTATLTAQDIVSSTPVSTTSTAQFTVNKVSTSIPDLTLTKTHTGTFSVGGTAKYGFTVKNIGNLPTSGVMTLQDALPLGLTIPDGGVTTTGINAADWTCTALNNMISCTSTVTMAAAKGVSTFEIVGIQVGSAAVPSVKNQATISGGGESNTSNNNAIDSAIVNEVPDLTVKKQSVGPLTVGSLATYQFTVTNIGKGATTGPMTTSDLLPAGLTVPDGPIAVTGANAADWICVSLGGDVDCSSSVSIPSNGSSTFTIASIQIDAAALPAVTNQVSIVGGGETNLTNNGGFDTSDVTPVTLTKPSLRLIKRMTSLNTTLFNQVLDDATDPNDDSTLNWPVNYLEGLTGKLIKPIDTLSIHPEDILEYSIYFLSDGNVAAKNVLFCDRVPDNVSFIANSYAGLSPLGITGLERGIQLFQNGASTNLTNVPDSDVGQYFPPGIEPAGTYPKVNCRGANTNGAIVVDLGNLLNATSPGTPNDSYGFVKFKGRVK
jgi:uncharacterized repeat protein (TIGR01451 family)